MQCLENAKIVTHECKEGLGHESDVAIYIYTYMAIAIAMLDNLQIQIGPHYISSSHTRLIRC